MVWVLEISIDTAPMPDKDLHLHVPMAHAFLGSGSDDNERMEGCYLDTDASSYMAGRAEAFSTLDRKVHGTMSFGEGSLVHIGYDALQQLCRRGIEEKQVCDTCIVTKQHRVSFPAKAKYRAKEALDLVQGDLCRPITPVTPGDQ
jgi:hypothetical protein